MGMTLRVPESQAVLQELRETKPLLPVVMIGDRIRTEEMEEMVTLGALGYMDIPSDPDAFKCKCLAFFCDPDKFDQ